MTPVAEEHTVRAIAVMVDHTAGFEVNEILLPENYLQGCDDSLSPQEREMDLEEMELDELAEEDTEEDILGSGEESHYDDDGISGKGKGKARKEVKKSTPANGKKAKPKKKPRPAEQALNELVGYSHS